MSRRLLIGLGTLYILMACTKEPGNPFDDLPRPSSNPDAQQLPPDNFAWIHQKILRPSCALSGCHDGHFEPDLRAIGSAYNSLVYHPVITNDPQQSFTYRVVPGNVNASLLHARLTTFIPNTSGIMPLGFAPGSDWPQHSAAYIQAIAAWIQGGARDMFGQPPTQGNIAPSCIGFLVFPAGGTSSAFPRGAGAGVQPVAVPAAPVDAWFAFADDQTAPQDLTYNRAKLATSPLAFATVPELTMTTNASFTGADFTQGQSLFTHRVTLDLSGYAPGTLLYVRAYVQDGPQANITEVPNDGTGAPLRDYFTLRITP